MDKKEMISKVKEKKDFSELASGDVEKAFSHFENREVSDEEKVRLTRELLHKVFATFTSRKLLSPKEKDPEWILRKHLSTRERLGFYEEIYRRVLKCVGREVSVIDLGSGVNGFSYFFFAKVGKRVSYLAVESVGQLVDLMNTFFEKGGFDARAVHVSLFELGQVKALLEKQEKPRVVFLFKTIDSLEMMERDFSKRLLEEIAPFCDRIVVSFATRSMLRRRMFAAGRKWLLDFVKENFIVSDEFEIGGEKFIVFSKNREGQNL